MSGQHNGPYDNQAAPGTMGSLVNSVDSYLNEFTNGQGSNNTISQQRGQSLQHHVCILLLAYLLSGPCVAHFFTYFCRICRIGTTAMITMLLVVRAATSKVSLIVQSTIAQPPRITKTICTSIIKYAELLQARLLHAMPINICSSSSRFPSSSHHSNNIPRRHIITLSNNRQQHILHLRSDIREPPLKNMLLSLTDLCMVIPILLQARTPLHRIIHRQSAMQLTTGAPRRL